MGVRYAKRSGSVDYRERRRYNLNHQRPHSLRRVHITETIIHLHRNSHFGGVSAPWVLEGAVDGEAFLTWLREVLGPTLQPGDIVVMDNLKAHKVAGVEQAITARGARLISLSPYSPDFNPIEQCWSKIKTFLRKAKARTLEALLEAIKQALATVTEADARA